jgi:hypothetical protein
MTPSEEEALWRSRFIAINLTRIGGTIVAIIGLAVWNTSWVRTGGFPALGVPLAFVGVIASFLGPLLLARRWGSRPKR